MEFFLNTPWQDIVITIIQGTLAVALIPTILGSQKPALLTSAMNTIALAFLAFTFSTLGLLISTGTTTAVTIMWAILWVQRYKQEK